MITFIIWILMGVASHYIFKSKNRSGGFVWGFFGGLLGVIITLFFSKRPLPIDELMAALYRKKDLEIELAFTRAILLCAIIIAIFAIYLLGDVATTEVLPQKV